MIFGNIHMPLVHPNDGRVSYKLYSYLLLLSSVIEHHDCYQGDCCCTSLP